MPSWLLNDPMFVLLSVVYAAAALAALRVVFLLPGSRTSIAWALISVGLAMRLVSLQLAEFADALELVTALVFVLAAALMMSAASHIRH